MADWSLPVNTTNYVDVLTYLKARDVDAGTLCYAAPTTPPTGMIQYLRAGNKFQEWNGSSWDDKVLAIAGGGTGGSSAAAARTALGLGTMATQADSAVSITGGTITGVSLAASTIASGEVALARGGTGASLSLGATGSFLQSNGSAVVFGVSGAALTGLNATNLASGTVNVARLAGITTTQMASANVSQFTNDAGYATTATASVPISTIIDYAGPTPLPAGVAANFLVCDGGAVSRVTYSALFAIVGTTYGAGDGVNTFNVPDCRQRSSIGTDGTYALAATGGSLAHTHGATGLSNDTHAGHTHATSGTTGAGSAHSHSMSGATASDGAHYHRQGNTGSTEPPDHGHSFTTDVTDLGVTDVDADQGDPIYSQVSVVYALSNAIHSHTGSTGGVNSTLAHVHSNPNTDNESGHTHAGGTLAAANESAHTHSSGSLAAASGGSHSHVLSGNTAAGSHAYIAFHKLIKYA